MTVKQTYKIGATVWIYGISRDNKKSTQGEIVLSFILSPNLEKINYVVAIPTDIETLFEVRTWETISQTKDGHVGALRMAVTDSDSAKKFLSRAGIDINSNDDEYTGDGHDGMGSVSEDFDDGPSADVIHAALEKSRKDVTHNPLILQDDKPKRRYFKKKKL